MTTTTIGDALFTKTQQRVLGLLYGQPQQSFYTNEIVRLADMGRGTISRELERLVSAGLLKVRREGNQHHYQANPDCPLYEDLIHLIQKLADSSKVQDKKAHVTMNDLVKNYRTQILSLAKQKGISNVRVFGSMARNEAGPESDLDLLVDIDKGQSGLALGGFLADVSELIHRKVDVVTEKSLHPKIRKKVLHEARAL